MTTCEWKVLGLIGEGAQSKVFLAENTTDLKKYALKLFSQETRENSEELGLVSKIHHESIIQMKASIDSADSLSFCDRECEAEFKVAGFHGGYAMEYAAHGDFLSLLENLGTLPELLVRSYAMQLIAALESLSNKRIAHGDLTLENLLLDENYCLKLADFGAAKSTQDSAARRADDENSTDVFSLGVMIFELICGHSPFERASSEDELYQLIVEDNWDEFWLLHEEICSYNHISIYSDVKELLQSLMNSDPKKRPAFRDIKNFDWMKKTRISPLKVGSWIQEIAKKKKAISVLSPISSL